MSDGQKAAQVDLALYPDEALITVTVGTLRDFGATKVVAEALADSSTQGYLAQIEGLQRELRDANAEIATLREGREKEFALRQTLTESQQTAWHERDMLSKELTDAHHTVRAAVKLLTWFASKA